MRNTFSFDVGQNLVRLATHFSNMRHDIHSFVTIILLNVEYRMLGGQTSNTKSNSTFDKRRIPLCIVRVAGELLLQQF